MMNIRFRGPLCALTLVLGTTSAAFADGIIRDSDEAISAGRGGTNIANFDNGAVILSNPAGILNAPGCGLAEVGVDGLITDLHYSNPINDDVGAHTRPMALPMASYFQKSSDGQWAAGIGIFAPAGFAAGWDLNSNLLGNQSYQSFGAELKILPAIAYRIADGLSIGATLGAGASYVELHTPFFIQTGPVQGAPVYMNLRGGMDFTPTWSVGLQYDLTPRTTLGLVYSSEDRFNLDGHVSVNVFGLGPQPVFGRFDSTLNVVWPQSVGAGLRHVLTDTQRVSVDVVWYNWSHAVKSYDLTLTNASNPLFTQLLGSTIHDTFAMDWHDSVSVRLGYEWSYSDINTVRAGYVFNSQQIPSANLTPLIPAILEHTFSIGHGTQFDQWRIDMAYQFSFGPDREVGTSALVGGDFSNSRINAQAHWLSLSLTRQF